MKKNLKYIVSFVILLLVGAVIFYGLDYFKYQNTNYAYVETNFIDVTPKVSGVIYQLNAKNNSKVRKGQIIAQLKPDEFIEKLDVLNDDLDINQKELDKVNQEYLKLKTLLNQKNEDLKKAQTNLDNANSDYVLYKIQYKDGTVTKNDLDKASKNISVAKNDFKLAQDDFKLATNNFSKVKAKLDNFKNKSNNLNQKIEKAKLDLKNSAIISPVDGIITDNILVQDKFIKANTKAAVIIPKDCYLIAYFNSSKAQDLKKEQIVEIKTNTFKNKKFKGVVESIENKDNKIIVKILFTNNSLSSKIQPKMSVKARIKPKN